MSKTRKDVEAVVGLAEDMKDLTVDKINETPVTEPEETIQETAGMSAKEMAKTLGCRYIEPTRKLSAFGTLPDKMKKERDRDWEYVQGMYENIESPGETLEFWLCLYPGDPDCMWSIPSNIPVYVPRMVAKHLESIQKYHKFGYVEKPQGILSPEEFTHEFKPVQTVWRGKFRAMNAFE